jgi:hypothetical protein
MNTSSPTPNAHIIHLSILGATVFSIGSKHPMALQKMQGRDFAQFNCTGDEQELTIFAPDISSAEALSFQTEQFRFGLQTYRDVIFLAYRCGSFHGDAPCSWHLNPETGRTEPTPMSSTDSRLGLMVVLVDSTNGIIKDMRLAPLSAKFSQALNAAVTNQSKLPWPGLEEYLKQIQTAYCHWKTPQKMMSGASVRFTEGA